MNRHEFRAAVFVIIRAADGHILLQQRAGTPWLPGYWDFPSGHVEPDESFADAMVRELREETTLEVQPQDLQIVHASINHTDTPYINIVFAADAWQGTPTIGEPEKCSAMQFFAPDALPDKLTLAVRNLLPSNFAGDAHGDLFVDRAAYEHIMGDPFPAELT